MNTSNKGAAVEAEHIATVLAYRYKLEIENRDYWRTGGHDPTICSRQLTEIVARCDLLTSLARELNVMDAYIRELLKRKETL